MSKRRGRFWPIGEREETVSEDRYRSTRDSHGFFKFILKFVLKIMWSIGGAVDGIDGLPRVRGDDIRGALPHFRPGDFILVGNNGGLSHIMLYVDVDRVVHSMATEKTMRGTFGSLWDALRRPVWWTFGLKEETGVIEETMTGFLDRYERDTWIVLRQEGLTEAQVQSGITHARSLVGKRYDYDFSAGDDEYYCTEIIVEFLEAAGVEAVFETRRVVVPMLLDAQVIEPVALFKVDGVRAVLANDAATQSWSEVLGEASICGVGNDTLPPT